MICAIIPEQDYKFSVSYSLIPSLGTQSLPLFPERIISYFENESLCWAPLVWEICYILETVFQFVDLLICYVAHIEMLHHNEAHGHVG